MRFAPIFAIEKREAVADFQAGLDDQYQAEPESLVQRAFAFGIGPDGVLPASTPQPEVVWPFQDREREWTISLSSTSLALEAVDYHDFDDFLAGFSSVLDTLWSVFKPQRQLRLGLRYINEIEDKRLGSEGLSFFVRKELVAAVEALEGEPVSSFSEWRFRQSDGVIAFRHGLARPTAYLLDFDYFDEEERDFDTKNIIKSVATFHDLIERLFVWSLADRYLKELKAKRK